MLVLGERCVLERSFSTFDSLDSIYPFARGSSRKNDAP
jgi:hypothetical protein